eukprot:9470062-Pyramimonas_sp.AAC.4
MYTLQLQSTYTNCARSRTATTRPPRVVSQRTTCHAGRADSQATLQAVTLKRRSAVLAPAVTLLASVGTPAIAVRDGPALDIEPIAPFDVEDFTPEAGWTELDSGLIYKVLKKGEGDSKAGIFDKVDYFQPFPFVTVRYSAYLPSGKGFASSYAERRDYNYQVGVRQELQDEDGAVMSMYVGERRQFVIPFELAFKRKLFGNIAPQNQSALLVEVELLKLQPY